MRGNEKYIVPRMNHMGQRSVDSGPKSKPFGMTAARDDEFAFVSQIALPEDHQANVIAQQAINDRENQVDSFLLRQPGNHAEDRSLRIGGQTAGFQQSGPAGFLAREIR